MEDILELEHSGIKGMKWGQRKLKNAVANRNINKSSRKRENDWANQYKKRGSMSNADLKRKIERLRMENDFNRLATEASAGQRAKAKMYIDGASKFANSPAGKQATSAIAKKLAKRAAVAAVL